MTFSDKQPSQEDFSMNVHGNRHHKLTVSDAGTLRLEDFSLTARHPNIKIENEERDTATSGWPRFSGH